MVSAVITEDQDNTVYMNSEADVETEHLVLISLS